MALQVWLPLNKDLINQGLSNISINDTGTTIDNNGKIGKCFKITAEKSLGYTPNFNDKGLSLCGWFKFNQSEINAVTSTQTYNSTWNKCSGNLIGNNYYGGIGLIWETNNIYSSGSLTSITIRSILRTPTFYKMTSGFNVEFDKWIHIILTWDPNTHVLSLYKDGVLFNSVSNIAAFTNGASHVLSISYKGAWGGNPRTPVIPIYENDIRVYDHCLSPKEVKEISKGLVLHYKLDDYLPPGVELYDYIQSDGTLWIDTKYVPNDTSGIYLRAYCTTSGGNYLAIGCRQTSGNTRWWINYSNYLELSWNQYTHTLTGYTNTWTEVEHNYMNSRSAKVNGTTYSVSYPTLANITYSAYLFNSCNQGNLGTGFIGRISNAKITEGTSIVRNYLPCTYLGEPGMWDTVENKFYRNQGTGQFILGNKITTTYNDNIIYDCSGYLNNGNITGNLTIVSDSSRYSMATCFNGSSYINRISLDSSSEVKTISFWANWSSVDFSLNYASQCILFVDNGTKTGFGLLSNKLILLTTSVAGESYTYPNQNFIANVWYHFVIVIADATTRDLYINGVKKTPTSNKNKWTYSVNQLQIGRRSTTSDGFNGKISDFRMYATTLSDEDIKELYDTSAIIDNKGNLYGYLFEELMDNIELNVPLWKFNKTSNPGGISFDGKDLVFTGLWCASYSEYIEVDITKTFYYDITYSSQEGSRFSIGFEKYDENKASTSNSGCVYIISTGGDVADKIRKTGTFTFGTINGNPCKYTKIRVLSCWTNSTIRDGVGKIHSFHFALVDGTGNSEVTKQGLIKTGWFIEDELLLTLISKNKYMTTNELIEI